MNTIPRISEQERILHKQIESFLQDIRKDPKSHTIRSILADWCEDNREPHLAEALRWIIKNNKYPLSWGQATSDSRFFWTWWTVPRSKIGPGKTPQESVNKWIDSECENLSLDLWCALPTPDHADPRPNDLVVHKGYTTFDRAEEALWLAYIKVFCERDSLCSFTE